MKGFIGHNMRWTEDQLQDHLAQFETHKTQDNHDADDGPEKILQRKIVKWAENHGYPCLSFSQSKKAKGFLRPGWPDITLIMKRRAIFIELKAAKGYLREEQKRTIIQIKALGHEAYVIKSFKKFLEIVKDNF